MSEVFVGFSGKRLLEVSEMSVDVSEKRLPLNICYDLLNMLYHTSLFYFTNL